MQVDELKDQMLAGEPGIVPVDVTTIRSRGRRLRWRRRVVTGTAALAVTGLVASGAVLVAGGTETVDRGVAGPTGTDREVTEITAFEQRVLDEVAGSFAVDGTVVVPGGVDTTEREMNRFFTDEQIDGRIRPLGSQMYADPGYLTGPDYPRFMTGIPEGSQVRADNGPAYLGCVEWETGSPCGVAVLVEAGDEFAYGWGLGTDDFLQPGAEMEVFIDGIFDGGVYRDRVIGGFDGTSATTVLLTLVDGSQVEANVDSGGLSAGDTLFWALVDAPVASVTAYDAEGAVVTSHEIRPCSSPVDCEVR